MGEYETVIPRRTVLASDKLSMLTTSFLRPVESVIWCMKGYFVLFKHTQ